MEIRELFNTIRSMLKHNTQLKYEKIHWGDDMCSFKARKKVKGWIEIWLINDHISFSNIFTPNQYGRNAIELYTETIKKDFRTLEEFYAIIEELNTQEMWVLKQQ